MGYSLREAAQHSGVSKTTIHRALKSGKISGVRMDDGSWSIDPAELARVYPVSVSGVARRDIAEQPEAGLGTASVAALEVEVKMLRQQLEREQETVSDLRARLDRAEDRVLTLTMEGLEVAKNAAQKPRGLWARIIGR